MDLFVVLPKTGVGALLDILLLAISAAVGRVAFSLPEALTAAWGFGVLTQLVALWITGPEMPPTYHVIPRLLICLLGAGVSRAMLGVRRS